MVSCWRTGKLSNGYTAVDFKSCSKRGLVRIVVMEFTWDSSSDKLVSNLSLAVSSQTGKGDTSQGEDLVVLIPERHSGNGSTWISNNNGLTHVSLT